MPSRHVHSPVAEVYATVHHPDGTHRVRMDGMMDLGRYEEARDTRRRGVEAVGGTLDSTDADEVWARRQRAQARYDAAFAWWQGDTLGRPHPGSLADWMDDAGGA
jgi:hypothetical protein